MSLDSERSLDPARTKPAQGDDAPMRVALFANTEWYLFNFRLGLAGALRERGHDVLLLSPPGPYGERLRDLGFDWQPVPMDRRSLNPLREGRLIHWLSRCLRDRRIDLVHGFTIKCAVYGALAGRLAGVPVQVNAVAGMGYVFISDAWRARLLRPPLRALMRLALDGPSSRLILQNGDDQCLFQRARLVRGEHIRLIPGSGVDARRFTPAKAREDLPQNFDVLLPTRLLWDKGLAEYVEAGRKLRQQGRSVRLLLAGQPDPGNPASVSESEVRAWVAAGEVEWLSHVDDMAGLLQKVDAVALPSYREGLPKCLIEAAACGLPIITTDVPGCRDVVQHEQTGLLVPVRDAAALAEAMARLQDDPELAARLGAAARTRALELYDERIVIERTLEVYQELLPEISRHRLGGVSG